MNLDGKLIKIEISYSSYIKIERRGAVENEDEYRVKNEDIL